MDIEEWRNQDIVEVRNQEFETIDFSKLAKSEEVGMDELLPRRISILRNNQ